MFNRVLVPLDGSIRAERALGPALGFLRESEGVLILLHAVATAKWFASPTVDPARQERRAAADYLARWAERLAAKGVHVQTRVATGEASRIIVDSAREQKADLIVLSSHGRGGVAERVLRTTLKPVLIVRGPASVVRKILVPLDGERGTVAILPAVRAAAHATGAWVTLLHVGPRLPEGVRRAGQLLSARGVSHRVFVRNGSPAATILEVAADEGADFVAVTSFGKRHGDRFSFGGVVEELLRRANRPLLIVKPPSRSPASAGEPAHAVSFHA